MLDLKKGTALAIPTIIGAMVGAQIATDISQEIFEKALAVVMIVMVYFILVKPSKWLKGQQELMEKKVSWLQIIIFFLIGVYGGFVQVGVGYFILAGVVLGAGYDLVRANAIKVWIVLLYTPMALLVFIFNNQVRWDYGLVHAIGNIIGAYLASHFAVTWGANFVRWVMIIFILATVGQLFGIYDLREIFSRF